MIEFKQFVERFNKSDEAKLTSQIDIDKLENEFKIFLPDDYNFFLLNFGNIWTPEILDLVVDKELDINDVQDFWGIDKIIYDKKNEWASKVFPEIIPFASDCMGNIFAFMSNDLRLPRETAEIYFFDHDFNTVEKISPSFKNWLEKFNKI